MGVADAKMELKDVGYVTVCCSSGYLLPGLSAYVVNDLKLPLGTVRCDIVGMGCHAGLNSLQAAANWANANPGKLAISCGVEVLSAHFLYPDELQGPASEGADTAKNNITHSLCNSLFADGCFAVGLRKPKPDDSIPYYMRVHEFASLTMGVAMDTMTYQWSNSKMQFWFNLSEQAPYAVGAALMQLMMDQQDAQVPVEYIRHIVLHTGGQAVIDSATSALGLDLPE